MILRYAYLAVRLSELEVHGQNIIGNYSCERPYSLFCLFVERLVVEFIEFKATCKFKFCSIIFVIDLVCR